MDQYGQLMEDLSRQPRRWLVTGAAGFIGSNLVETLLRLNQYVRGLDNFATGKRGNLDELKQKLSPESWGRFEFIEGDVRRLADCLQACHGIDYVLHQAALGSVPRSIEDPLLFGEVNVMGTLNILVAARDQKVRRTVYASSSSVYGDNDELPKREPAIGRPLSPYAATKVVDEIFANVFATCYQSEVIGLRYFNVFGPRQDPEGAYAAVIPKWIAALVRNEPVFINGDGSTSRDFCFVGNVVQANLLAATCPNPAALNRAYNVALGARTTLTELYRLLVELTAVHVPEVKGRKAQYREFRAGDIPHSHADISEACDKLGYRPTADLLKGLQTALPWYLENL